MRTRVTFDGYDLSEQFVVSDLRNPLLPRRVAASSAPGRDGSVFTEVRLEPRTIGMTLTVIGQTDEDRQAASRVLASVLATRQPAPLYLSIDGGLYYMAVAESVSDGERYHNATSFDVSFIANDPVAYGAERRVTVPSGGTVTFRVGGTYPTAPRIAAPSAANGNGGFWRLRLEDGSYIVATIPSGLASAPVVVDCSERVLTVNGSTTLLSPTAEWLSLSPGEHTLEMHGTGAATVTFQERWL